MSFAAALYLQLLAEPKVPTQVQWRAYKLFSLEKNENALAELTAHPDLAPELDTLLGAHKSVKVRAKWAQRPGRTLDDLKAAFNKEKRITMLEIGAQIPGMPDDWYKQMLSNPSAKVAAHIVVNDEVSLEVRKLAARIHASGSSDYRSMGAHLTLIYASRPELHGALAAGGGDSREILQFVAGSELDEAAQQRVIDRAIKPFLVKLAADEKGYAYRRWEKMRDAQSALNAAENFAKQPKHSPTMRENLRQVIAAFDTNGYDRSVEKSKEEVLAMLDRDPEDLVDTMKVAATTTDLELLTEMVKQVIADSDADMGIAIASNKNVTPELMDKLLHQHFSYSWYERLLTIHKANPAVVAVVLGHTYYCNDDHLELAEDPDAALNAYIELIARQGKSVPQWVMQSNHMKLEMLTRTPFHVVAEAALSDSLRTQLMQLLQDRLGEAPDEAWALFESVANSSGASLGDVIDATATLAQLG